MIEDQYPTPEELLLRAQDGLAREVDRVLDEAGSVRASLLGRKRPGHPPASVAGYRFMGLRAVGAQAERDRSEGGTPDRAPEPTMSRSASASDEYALWLTRDQLAWLAALLGDQPYGYQPGDTVYEKASRALTMLAVLDEGS